MNMPAQLQQIIEVRRSIGDPITADFVIVATLPETALPKTAHTTGDGRYWFFDGVDWRLYALKFNDAYIQILVNEQGRHKAAIRLVDDLLARLDPADYLTAGNAGGQSVSFSTLTEAMEFYRVLRERLMEADAAANGMNSGLMVKIKRRPVGGVLEDYE